MVGKRAGTGVPGGTWEPAEPGWRAAPPRICACCGRPLFGRTWRAETRTGRHDFCAPACEQLYLEYVLERHGAESPKG